LAQRGVEIGAVVSTNLVVSDGAGVSSKRQNAIASAGDDRATVTAGKGLTLRMAGVLVTVTPVTLLTTTV